MFQRSGKDVVAPVNAMLIERHVLTHDCCTVCSCTLDRYSTDCLLGRVGGGEKGREVAREGTVYCTLKWFKTH